jgi:hypothetical protein
MGQNQEDPPQDAPGHTRFAEFYRFYLNEHSERSCRRMHSVGNSLSLACLAMHT